MGPVDPAGPPAAAGEPVAAQAPAPEPGDTIVCPSCAEEVPAGATWCEACGHELSTEPKPACVACGEREVDVDEGYCLSCGHRQPRERDHLVLVDATVVAVSDRGRRHHHNEDAAAIARVPNPLAGGDGSDDDGAELAVLVVCDGVSSTPGSAEASALAATAALDVLVDGLAADGGVDGEGIDHRIEQAVAAAQDEASAVVAGDADAMVAPGGGPPSSTLVMVVARPVGGGTTELTTAWVGDSRAYWIGADNRRLTLIDHELDGGLVRWLGADSVNPNPDIDTVVVSGPGHLVVCTDGLWRYAAEPRELAELVGRFVDDESGALDLAEGLVEHANTQGGHDNITVALWSNRPGWPDRSHPDGGDGAPAGGDDTIDGEANR